MKSVKLIEINNFDAIYISSYICSDIFAIYVKLANKLNYLIQKLFKSVYEIRFKLSEYNITHDNNNICGNAVQLNLPNNY